LSIGDTAPDFLQESTLGPLSFHSWLGDDWGLLHGKFVLPLNSK
jgi:hypothetical protein